MTEKKRPVQSRKKSSKGNNSVGIQGCIYLPSQNARVKNGLEILLFAGPIVRIGVNTHSMLVCNLRESCVLLEMKNNRGAGLRAVVGVAKIFAGELQM